MLILDHFWLQFQNTGILILEKESKFLKDFPYNSSFKYSYVKWNSVISIAF